MRNFTTLVDSMYLDLGGGGRGIENGFVYSNIGVDLQSPTYQNIV